MIDKPNAISLFSGIGGLDIGFSKAGYNIIAQVEIDTFCQCILKRHKREWWPDATIFPDVRRFGRDSIAGEIEIIFGGFPCQPHSVAGKRLGAEDARSLWPEFRRIIGEFRPRTILLENVPGILTGYATIVIADLTEMGYDCRWGTIQAADTGAPHKRERWFCVANDNGQRQLQQSGDVSNIRRRTAYKRKKLANTGCPTSRMETLGHYRSRRQCPDTRKPKMVRQKYQAISAKGYRTGRGTVGNTISTRLPKRQIIRRNIQQQLASTQRNGNTPRPRQRRIIKSRLDRATDGLPAWLDKPRWPAGQGTYQHDWEAPRTIGKGIDPNRVSRIKALGNAVMPQIAYALAIEIGDLS